jgi:DNA-binding NarL/FixJ family response regulator
MTSQSPLRILLADDHEVVRRGVRTMLAGRDGWHVAGEASNGREAVDLAMSLKPDIAVMDLEMPELNGLEVTRLLRQNLPEVEILIFTMHETEYLIREVLGAGARGYVLKSDGGRKLVEAIESLAMHKPFLTAKASEALLESFRESHVQSLESSLLTDREREIVRILADGKSNKESAALLGISVKTVETHRAAIMRKLGCNSLVSVVRYAVRNKLIDP